MLKIQMLKDVRDAATEEGYAAADAAYYAEYKAAKALQAQYEAMEDTDLQALTNAGDTFSPREHGDIVLSSTEYWLCAVMSVQFFKDFS